MKHFSVLVDKKENILRQWESNRKYRYVSDFFYVETPTDSTESNNLTDDRIEKKFEYFKTEQKKWLFWKRLFHFYKEI